jgi:hypothetical protein
VRDDYSAFTAADPATLPGPGVRMGIPPGGYLGKNLDDHIERRDRERHAGGLHQDGPLRTATR